MSCGFMLNHMSTFFQKLIAASIIGLAANFSVQTVQAQPLTWTYPQFISPGEGMQGQPARQAVSSVVFNNKLYVVYTAQASQDTIGQERLLLIESNDGINFTMPFTVGDPNETKTLINPSIAVVNGTLCIAYNKFVPSQNSSPSNGITIAYIMSSADGINWSSLAEYMRFVKNSPSIIDFKNNLYAALTNDKDSSIVFCRISGIANGVILGVINGVISGIANGIASDRCDNWLNNRVNFNPALGTFGDRIYVDYSNQANDHQLWMLYSNDAGAWTTSPNTVQLSPFWNCRMALLKRFARHRRALNNAN